jgi:hypothetical protein
MAALGREGAGQEALLAGDADVARAAFAEAAELYRQSWEAAHPTAYGRLVGMLKAAVLAGRGPAEAEYARGALVDTGGAGPKSPTASYACALAALILGEDETAEQWARSMSAGGEAFARTAEAIGALAARDQSRYGAALAAIVRDFEQRARHLTGVAIADTALTLSVLATRRGMAVAIESPVLPGMSVR